MQIIYGDFPMLIPKNRKNSGRFIKFVAILLSMLIGSSIIVCALWLCKDYKIKPVSLYCFCPYTQIEYSSADQLTQTVKNANGAGVTVNQDGKISIIACVFMSEDEAISVAEKNDGSVLKITIDQIVVKDKNRAQKIKNDVNEYFKTLERLIYFSTALETKTESEYVALSFVNHFEDQLGKEGIYYSIPILSGTLIQKIREYSAILVLEWQKYARNIK